MSFSSLHKGVAFLLAGIGLISLTFGGELSLVALAVLGAGFIASWFMEGELLERPWWSRGWNVLLVAALGVQILRAFDDGGWLGYAMEFAGLLTVSRLCNRRSAAEYQQIAMLAFMQLIAATVLTTDLGYAGVFVAFVIVTPWALTLAQMRFEIERNYPKPGEIEGSNDTARVLASKRIVGPRFLLWTALLSLPMLAMTLSLFMIFPRVGLGFVSFGDQRGQHVAGFGNKVELGGFGVIRDDPTVVVRITPSRALTPSENARYLRLRGTAFDHYDGRRWTRSDGHRLRMSPMGEFYTLRRAKKPGDLELKVILDRLDEPVLFVPPGAVGLRIPFRGMPGGRERVTIVRSHGLDLRYQSAEGLGVMYDVIVSTDEHELDIPPARDTDEESRYLQVPKGHEKVAALAKKLTAGLTTPEAMSSRLLSHLRDGNRYVYSLEQPEVGKKQPLDVFLFEARRGHCEYFATALAIMLRSLGVPARNVTGFVGGEYNPYGGYFAIRQADAHSWVEAYVPERGWITLDPTPPGRDEMGPVQWLFSDVSAMIDAMRAYWMTRVVGFDLRTQVRGLRDIRAFFDKIEWPSFGGGEREQKQREVMDRASGGSTSILIAVVGLFVLAGAAVFALRILKRKRGKRLRSVTAEEARELYLALERLLEKKGKARPPHVTPEAHARDLKQQGFPAADAVVELTDVYVQARYGDLVLPVERVRNIRKKLDDIRNAA